MIGNILWLALCIYFEGRGEPKEGQLAIGHVIMTRVERRDASIKNIVRAPWQFSWLNPGAKRPVLDDLAALETCMNVAIECLAERLDGKDFYGADHYFADYIAPPAWAGKMKFIRKVGKHLFYKS
jgi:N-acetylmuramoyl-L-alanine amidase